MNAKIGARIVRSVVLLAAAVAMGPLAGAAETKPAASTPDALKDKTPSVRLRAVKALAKRSDRASIDVLISVLADEDLRVSESSFEALENMKSPLVVAAFLDALRNTDPRLLEKEEYRSGDRKVPDPAEELLASLEDPYVAKALVAGLEHKNGYARGLSAVLLAKVGRDERTAGALKALVDRTTSDAVREAAGKALAAIKPSAQADASVKTFRTSKDIDARIRAVKTLLEKDHPMAVDLLMEAFNDRGLEMFALRTVRSGRWKPKHIEPLMKGLKKTNALGRQTALWVLIRSKDRRVVPALIECLADASPDVVSDAAEGLAKIPDKRALDPLLKTLGHSDESVREHAARALGLIGDKKAAPALIALLQNGDMDDFSREEAARALGRIGDKRALEPLLEALDDDDLMEHSVVFALGRLGGGKAAKKLIELYESEDGAGMQKILITALADTKDPEALKVLRQAVDRDLKAGELGFGTPWHRCKVLMDMGDPGISAVLVKAATDKTYKGRKDAMNCLDQLHDAAACKALAHALHDDDEDVRSMAMLHLSLGKHKLAVPFVITALKGKSAEGRSQAAFVLTYYKDIRAVPALIEALGDKDRRVRLMAAKSLTELTGQKLPRKLTNGSDHTEWKTWWQAWYRQNKNGLTKRLKEQANPPAGDE